jgi:uncharacterized membrane protein
MTHNQDPNLRTSKRNKFVQPKPERRRSPTLWLFGGGALLIAVVLGWILKENMTLGAAQAKAGELPAVQDGAYRLPAAHFDDGQAHFYTHEAGGKPIQFFVLKSRDGVIRAAFNACDVCYLDKQGYRQEGDEMICKACGKRFPSELINEVRGGCNPSPLERTIKGGEVIIRVEDIVAGANYF